MTKDFKYAVFLSLFFKFAPDLYRETFNATYEKGHSPMTNVCQLIGNQGQRQAESYAVDLLEAPPKVVK